MDSRTRARQDAPMFSRTALLSLLFAAACSGSSPSHDAPFAVDSPWPKFRDDAAQNGRGSIKPTATTGAFWSFRTGKGIFSSPVVAGDGTIYVGSADRTLLRAARRDGSVSLEAAHRRDHRLGGAARRPRARLLRLRRRQAARPRRRDRRAGLDDDRRCRRRQRRPTSTGSRATCAIADGRSSTCPTTTSSSTPLDRDTGALRGSCAMPDQTWSSPAIDHGERPALHRQQQPALRCSARTRSRSTRPASTKWEDYVGAGLGRGEPAADAGRHRRRRRLRRLRARLRRRRPARSSWQFGARDHIYASPARLSDGTIVQPSTDGTRLRRSIETTGELRWTFDTREPIRSSPAVDGDDNVYFGSGDGRLYVLNKDGTLRWSMQLIDDDRNDLNSSPALGKDAIYLGGESGEVFSVPYDYCLRARARPTRAAPHRRRRRCRPTAQRCSSRRRSAPSSPRRRRRSTPTSRSSCRWSCARAATTRWRCSTRRRSRRRRSARAVQRRRRRRRQVRHHHADRALHRRQRRHRHHRRERRIPGLARSHGPQALRRHARRQRQLHDAADAERAPRSRVPPPLAPGTAWEVSRLALPLPTILPSYNQIGFDSLHYLVGIVESDATGGASPGWPAPSSTPTTSTVIDPATQALFPLAGAQRRRRSSR